MAFSIDTSRRTPNTSARRTPPSAILIHTGEGTKDSDLATLHNPRTGDPRNGTPQDRRVSSNYYVDRAGNIYELAPPELETWHAGPANYAGITNWNDASVGIETEHKAGQDWPRIQRDALAWLCRYLIQRFNIPKERIAAHRWVAEPRGRKSDPSDWSDGELRAWIAALYGPANPASPPPSSDLTPYRVRENGTRVRVAPTTRSDQVTTLSAGEVVQVRQTVDGAVPPGQSDRRWAQVIIRDTLEAFVHLPLLEPLTAPPVPPASPAYTENSPMLGVGRADLYQLTKFFVERTKDKAGRPTGEYSERDIQDEIVAPLIAECALANLNHDLVAAQMFHESRDDKTLRALASFWAGRPRRNPAGIGVNGETRPGKPDEPPGADWAWDGTLWRRGISFASWKKHAIPAFVWRVAAYAMTDEQANEHQRQQIDLALQVRPLPAALRGSVTVLKELGAAHNRTKQGWANPGTEYGAKIAEHANAIVGIDHG